MNDNEQNSKFHDLNNKIVIMYKDNKCNDLNDSDIDLDNKDKIIFHN